MRTTFFFYILFKYYEFDNTEQNPIYYYRCQDCSYNLFLSLSIPLLVYNLKGFINSNNIPEQ